MMHGFTKPPFSETQIKNVDLFLYSFLFIFIYMGVASIFRVILSIKDFKKIFTFFNKLLGRCYILRNPQ